jgi:ATP-dependent Clp protease ATP-binding subunit ClpC
VKTQQYEQAAALRDQEKKVLDKLEKEKANWADAQKNNLIPISVEDVYEMISSIVGIPISKMDVNEIANLLNLENKLN